MTITKPWVKINVSLVLSGKPGIGKGIIVEILKSLLGMKYVSEPNSLEDVTVKEFNSNYFENCLLLHLNECFYVGDKRIQKPLLKLQTEKSLTINKKYAPSYTVENCFNIIMASNETYAVHCQQGQRRNMILRCNDEHNDSSYFEKIASTNIQILMNYFHSLQHLIKDWNPNKLLCTKATMDHIIHSLDSMNSFIFQFLQDPELIQSTKAVEGTSDELQVYIKKDLYKLYTETNKCKRFQHESNEFFKNLKKVITSMEAPRDKKCFSNDTSYQRVCSYIT
jgi:phage/plasmid-associated DNA primase